MGGAGDTANTGVIATPWSAKTLLARVTAVIEHPRPVIRSPRYCGPDRRRRQSPDYTGPERRKPVADGEGTNLSQEEVEALLDE